MRKQYVNVKISVELADEVDKILEKKVLDTAVEPTSLQKRLEDKFVQIKM